MQKLDSRWAARVYTLGMTEIGKVTHYYGKVGVAIVALSAPLKVGDKIKIAGTHGEDEQVVDSLEVEHQPVQEAKAGDVVGLKVNREAREGDTVSRVEG